MQYQVSRKGHILGSYDHSTLLALLHSGTLRIDDHYWHEGMVDWRQLVDFVGMGERRQRWQFTEWMRRHRTLLLQSAALVAAAALGGGATMMMSSRGTGSASERGSAPPAPVPVAAGKTPPVKTAAVTVTAAPPTSAAPTVAPSPPPAGERTAPAPAPPKPQATPLPAADIYRKISPSVVLLQSLDKDNKPTKMGSGFYVGDGHWIATNRHVIEDSEKVEIVLEDGTVRYPLACRASDDEHDIALLRVAVPGVPVPWASKSPEIGNRVYALGNPRGLERTLSDGLLSAHRKLGKVQLYQMTAPISSGSSGGPVVGDTGELVGMSTLTWRGGQNLNFAVRESDIRAILESAKDAPIVSIRSPDLRPDAGPKPDLDLVSAEDGGSVLAVTLRNTGEQPITKVLVRLVYHELPPASLREDELEAKREAIVGVVKVLEDKIANLELAQEAYATGVKFLRTDPRYWTSTDLRGLPAASVWLKFDEDQLASIVSDLRNFWAYYVSDRESTNRYLRQFADETERGTLAKLARSYTMIIDARVEELADLRAERADALLKAKSLLRKNDADAAKAKIEGPQAREAARKKVSHYKDLVVTEQIDPGLTKRVIVSREKNDDWGVTVQILDYSTKR